MNVKEEKILVVDGGIGCELHTAFLDRYDTIDLSNFNR